MVAGYLFDHNQQDLWIAAHGGLYFLNSKTYELSSCQLTREQTGGIDYENNYIYAVEQDNKGNIWIATRAGLNKYNRHLDTFIHYSYSNDIYSIYPEENGRLVLGTYQGVVTFDPFLESFTQVGESSQNRRVYAIVKDHYGEFWMSTDDGIIRLNKSGEVVRYNKDDGIYNRQFISHSLYSTDGWIYFGGNMGFTRFQPESIIHNPVPPTIATTALRISHTPVNTHVPLEDQGHNPLVSDISYASHFELNHPQNDLEIDFTSLDFTAPMNNMFEYWLTNSRRDTIRVSALRRVAQFSNLDPGKYVLHIRGTNNDEIWSLENRTISFRIRPPLWATSWAYSLYAIIFLGLLLGIRRYELRTKLARVEIKQQKELNKVLTRFFTDITHEFRTPLTIIIGMADQMKNQTSESVKEGLLMIQRNGKQILNLVNDVLDLNKLEAGYYKVDLEQGDICVFFSSILPGFVQLAEQKGIDMEVAIPSDSIMMQFDSNAMTQVVSNLLSNAIKFTPAGKKIKAEIARVIKGKDEFLLLNIADAGRGISKERQAKIFDRYVNDDIELSHTKSNNSPLAKGSGLGLAITKQWVHLLKGSIELESVVGEGSTFSVTLPIYNQLPDKIDSTVDYSPSAPVLSHGEEKNEEGPSIEILIVEDNKDLMDYLVRILGKKYKLILAFDGQDGWKKARTIIPDLVISDIMMPRMDGFELCRSLKSHEHTCHLPIIVLTARVDQKSKLRGIKEGADAYLKKPFSPEELNLQIQNLVRQRKTLQEYFRKLSGVVETGQIESNLKSIHQHDRKFISRLKKVMFENMSNQNLNVQYLANSLFMSTSTFYRKVKGLTGLSPVQYIRMSRLQRAKKQLSHTEKSIVQIAQESGFSNSEYFAKRFKMTFGTTPSEFRNK